MQMYLILILFDLFGDKIFIFLFFFVICCMQILPVLGGFINIKVVSR